LRIAVIGAGSWGTALAAHLASADHQVRVWAFEPDVVDSINARHVNPRFLPGIALPERLAATRSVETAALDVESVVIAVPSEFCRYVYRELRPWLAPQALIVSATKGLDAETHRRMSQILGEELPEHRIVVLSGPSFALEVARGQPTAVVAAAADLTSAERIQRTFSTRALRVYSSADVVGVELGGALKNVIAIAAGVLDGLGFGHNTLAALITRGLTEISRIAVALGARAETMAGLAGLGDLVLTCTGGLSRNRRVGQAIGRGESWQESLGAGMVAEGVRTTMAACELAESLGVEMPIADQMRAILYEGKTPRAAVEELMLRSLKRE
jgi:glycerol-3-phosphate dehydrogenase (NAD(P)+)